MFAPIGAALALVVLSLLFSGDWNRVRSGGEVDSSLRSATTQVPVTTTNLDAPTTSPPVASLADLTSDDVVQALAVAGFPNISVSIDGAVVTLRGVVPDSVSRRAVLNQVGGVPGVEEIIDELTVN